MVQEMRQRQEGCKDGKNEVQGVWEKVTRPVGIAFWNLNFLSCGLSGSDFAKGRTRKAVLPSCWKEDPRARLGGVGDQEF